MSQSSSEVLSVFRSLAIFTAFAFGFYFLLVWNPLSTFGDVRNYFEHRVRVPVEWILAVFPIAWLVQRNDGYTAAAAVFVPISVLILTLTKPDYGAEFWRIFRYEVYLDPVYVPRGLLVCFLLLFPSYRKLPKEFVRDHQEDFPIYLFLGVFLGLSAWAFSAAQGSAHGMGTNFLLGVLSIPLVLAMIALFLSSIVWIPAGLFILPAWLFWVVSQPFKVVYFLVVKVPFMMVYGLHYLMVPHPLEEVIKKYEEVRARDGAKIDYASFAEKMARGRYNWVRDGLPAWWKSKNWEKRLKDTMALRGRVRAEKDVAEKYTEEFRKDHRQ